jgi:hypothetical protein
MYQVQWCAQPHDHNAGTWDGVGNVAKQASAFENSANQQPGRACCAKIGPQRREVAMDQTLVPRVVSGRRPSFSNSRQINQRIRYVSFAQQSSRFRGNS